MLFWSLPGVRFVAIFPSPAQNFQHISVPGENIHRSIWFEMLSRWMALPGRWRQWIPKHPGSNWPGERDRYYYIWGFGAVKRPRLTFSIINFVTRGRLWSNCLPFSEKGKLHVWPPSLMERSGRHVPPPPLPLPARISEGAIWMFVEEQPFSCINGILICHCLWGQNE